MAQEGLGKEDLSKFVEHVEAGIRINMITTGNEQVALLVLFEFFDGLLAKQEDTDAQAVSNATAFGTNGSTFLLEYRASVKAYLRVCSDWVSLRYDTVESLLQSNTESSTEL